MNKTIKTFQYGQHQVTLETGAIARQATAAVMVRMGETVVLVTVVGMPTAAEGRDFFPLTVNYQERTYAAGKIPGGYFRREGRPTERETLISRLIDRPIRPLFPKGFRHEVQIVAAVMSLDPNVQPDIPAIIGASAALMLSGMPFLGPIAAARVGYREGQYLLNFSSQDYASSQLDLVVAGTQNAVLMVESEAHELSEEVMLQAVLFGHREMQAAITAIHEFVGAAGGGRTVWDWQAPQAETTWVERIGHLVREPLSVAYAIQDKPQRREKIQVVWKGLLATLAPEIEALTAPTEKILADLFHNVEREIVRQRILGGALRIDGRDNETVRPITIDVGVLPRAHGSAIFTRGETQAVVTATLGTERDAQMLDELQGDKRDRFMLHYNFPPYCVGEVGMMSGPKRREIGHGRLARRAMTAMLPVETEFPYVLRVVSEITESNGSSSMATVCGTSLALMDAGVPIKNSVAGIAMGLIKEGDSFAVLTDILGDEDHLGDMDFKVAGTRKGVTALQMDMKITGITEAIMHKALAQAQAGRLHILGLMEHALAAPRQDVSLYAPRIITIQINPAKIRDVIGKGGAVIREITEETQTTIDITDDGVVKIAAVDAAQGERARQRIELIVADVEIGQVYVGTVVKIVDFGAFVAVLPGREGLVHISQISQQRIQNVHDVLKEGQQVRVKVIEIDPQGRIRLSMKEAEMA